MPVTPDVDDDALESLAHEKGVGSLVKPVAMSAREMPPTPAPAARPASDVASAEAGPVVSAAGDNAPTPRSRMKTVNIELPDYAWTDLKIRAARQQVSVRHVIMCALREQGIAFADADLIEDGRKLRS